MSEAGGGAGSEYRAPSQVKSGARAPVRSSDAAVLLENAIGDADDAAFE